MADYYNNGIVLEQANEITDLRAQLAERDAEVGRLREACRLFMVLAETGRSWSGFSWEQAPMAPVYVNAVLGLMRAALKGER